MFLRLPKEVWQELKLVLHITQVLKFGMIGLMMLNVIYGLLDVLYTKWQLLDHLLELIIWKNFMLKFKRVSMSLFLNSTLRIWDKLYHYVWKFLLHKEYQQYRFLLIIMYWKICLLVRFRIKTTVKQANVIY
jgi:hypothetical protein